MLKQQNFDLQDELGHSRILCKLHEAEIHRKNTQLQALLANKPPQPQEKLLRQLKLVRAEMKQKEQAWCEEKHKLEKIIQKQRE